MIDIATRFGTLDVLAGPPREGAPFVVHGTGQVRD